MIENVKIAQSLESVITADLKIEIDSSSIEIDFEEYRMFCSVTPDFTVRGFVEALVYFIKSDDESKRLTFKLEDAITDLSTSNSSSRVFLSSDLVSSTIEDESEFQRLLEEIVSSTRYTITYHSEQ